MVFAQVRRANNANPRIMTDHEVQVLNSIGPVAHGAGVEFEDFLFELIVSFCCVGPGLRCLPKIFGLDFEVFECALLALVVGVYRM